MKKNQIHRRVFALLVLTFLQSFATQSAYSQPGTSYTLGRNVLDNGGGTDISETYTLSSSVGQSVAGGNAQNETFMAASGFLSQRGFGGAASKYAFTLIKRGAGSGTVTIDQRDRVTPFTHMYDTDTQLTLQALPNEMSEFLGWSGGGCNDTPDCVVTIVHDTVVTAQFAVKTFSITTSVNDGSSSTPFENAEVKYGSDYTVTFPSKDKDGYNLVEVLVDGISQGKITEYTFVNVTEAHTLEALFAIKTYAITTIVKGNGTITPNTFTAEHLSEQTFTLTPETGHQLDEILLNNTLIHDYDIVTERMNDEVVTRARLLITDIVKDYMIEARFSRIPTNTSFVQNGVPDINKSLTNPDDDWMCWAAAAANILEWANWMTDAYDTSQKIFDLFQVHWTDAGGLMKFGWEWWFEGTLPPDWVGWSQLNEGWSKTDSGGNFFSSYNFSDYFFEDWAFFDFEWGTWSEGSHLMMGIDNHLQDNSGVALAIYSESEGHALTAIGYEQNEFGDYTGIWVNDSDDYTDGAKLLSLTLKNDLWYLDPDNNYGYDGWWLGGYQGLTINPDSLKVDPVIPEPATLVLMGLGLLLLLGQLWKRSKQS